MKRNVFIFVCLVITSFIICLDLVLNPGEPATFDGPIHITNIAQFHHALRNGDFPVTWANNFSNYGSPIPIVAQQLPTYAGAFIMFLTGDPLVAYKILIILGYTLTSIFLYIFLRRFFDEFTSFCGTTLFVFSQYRIINLYIRGAGPELLSLLWVPIILIGIDKLFKNERFANLITSLGLIGLILTHPLIFVIAQFIFIPYIIFLWYQTRKHKLLIMLALDYLISLMVGMYYLLPLILEMKYFLISRKPTQLIPEQYLSLSSYFQSGWSYFGDSDIFVRKNTIRFGVPETVILLSGVILLFLKQKHKTLKYLLRWSLLGSVVLVFFTLEPAGVFYQHVPLLDSIQFPWRMLTILSIFPPIIACIWLDKIKNKWMKVILVALILGPVVIERIPQIYGKNYTVYPLTHYAITAKNLYFDEMNTLWTGSTQTYPERKNQTDIISGQGIITNAEVKNSRRTYSVEATSPLRLVDYTFYFPGWHVYVDGTDTPIEFQDEKFRGVITYLVPQGNHQVIVRFEPTKVRALGNLITMVGCTSLAAYLGFEKKITRRFLKIV